MAFALGARTGVFTVRMRSLRRTSSKAALYLLSRSRFRKHTPIAEVETKIARLLGDPGAARIR